MKAAERERDRDRLAASQLMAEVEAKAALMQEQQVWSGKSSFDVWLAPSA